MYLWLLSACFSVAQPTFIYNPGYPYPNSAIVTNGAPPPIITPTSSPTLPPLTPVPTSFPQIDPRTGNRVPSKLVNDEPIKFGDTGFGTRTKRDIMHKRKKRQLMCGCHPIAQCPNTNGAGLIDFRIIAPPNTTQQCISGYQFCCPMSAAQQSCGARLQTSIIYPTTAGQAKYGDYPWMVGILTNDNVYVGGGVLIDLQHVLTTAHRITSYPNGSGIKIRVGEWDYSGNYEQYPYRDSAISRVWIHESYNPSTLQNDLALLRMSTAIPLGTPGVIPICMPTTGQVFDGQRCWVAGWGKDSFASSGFQTVLKAVDVPVLQPASCETTLRTTRLGSAYVLDRAAFICAGGELNKDSCTGDGGSGLVCETSAGRWTLAGLVAWGLGCGTQGVPAAYVNIPNYLSWISTKQATT